MPETVPAALSGEQIGNFGMFQWPAHWSGNALHHRDSRQADEASGHPVQRDEIGRVSHVMVCLDHQHLGEQLALGEVSICRREAQVGGCTGRLVLTVVVILPVGRHENGPRLLRAPDLDW